MLISIIIKLTINLIYDISIPTLELRFPTVFDAQFEELENVFKIHIEIS